jgi:hypothetical protein
MSHLGLLKTDMVPLGPRLTAAQEAYEINSTLTVPCKHSRNALVLIH